MNEAREEKRLTNELVDHYIKTHSKLSRTMVDDYKQNAINNVILELYCKD